MCGNTSGLSHTVPNLLPDFQHLNAENITSRGIKCEEHATVPPVPGGLSFDTVSSWHRTVAAASYFSREYRLDPSRCRVWPSPSYPCSNRTKRAPSRNYSVTMHPSGSGGNIACAARLSMGKVGSQSQTASQRSCKKQDTLQHSIHNIHQQQLLARTETMHSVP